MCRDSSCRVTLGTCAHAAGVAVVLARAWLTPSLCLFPQVVALSSWSLLRDSIYYTLSVVALIVVSFLKVLHLWEPVSTVTCKGNLPWHQCPVAEITAQALMGISACRKLLVASLVLLGSVARGQEMEKCLESPKG